MAYALPILAKIDPTRTSTQAVIIVPSRELGFQVSKVMRQLAAGCDEKISIMALLEGSKNIRQSIWVVAEPPHVIICNIPSLQYLIDTNRVKLNAVSIVVVDEIDAILSKHDTKLELHHLLSRRLSTTFKTSELGQ